MSNYLELLKHPKWQKKRLGILEAHDFTCDECGDTEATLHVHHRFYKKKAKPWEYEDGDFAVLCVTCHDIVTENLREFRAMVGSLDIAHQLVGFGYVLGLLARMDHDGPPLNKKISPPEVALGIADAWGIEYEDVVKLAENGEVTGAALAEIRVTR